MLYSFALAGVLLLVDGYPSSDEDRYYFKLILQALGQYPIIKQTLIRLCDRELDKCKSERLFRPYVNIINDDELGKTLNHLIDCFLDSATCLSTDDWQQWSEWSSCSVTCGTGRIVRTRSCKVDRQCLFDSISIQSKSCLTDSCPDEHLTVTRMDFVTSPSDWKARDHPLKVTLIFVFPFVFTLLCLPLCVLYYMYELDFQLHAFSIQLFSLCHRQCQTMRRINIR